MTSCKKIITVFSKSEDLSFLIRIQMQIHFLMCKNCMRYKQHLKILNNCIRKLIQNRMIVTPEEIKEIEEKNYKK